MGRRTWWVGWTNLGPWLADQGYFTNAGWSYRTKQNRALYVVVAGVLLAIFAW
jgi:hypothetical protein